METVLSLRVVDKYQNKRKAVLSMDPYLYSDLGIIEISDRHSGRWETRE